MGSISPETITILVGVGTFVLGLLINRDKDPQWRGEVSAKLDMLLGLAGKVSALEKIVSGHEERIENHETKIAEHECELRSIQNDVSRIGGRRKDD